jgi:hypothetical protein
MALRKLLSLQIVYALLGIGYNVVSYFQVSSGGQQLSSTDPLTGGLVMFCYGLFLIPGFLRSLKIYRVLMIIAIIGIGYGGVVKHIINYFSNLEIYSSIAAWACALGINLFGLVLNVMAAAGLYRIEK